MQDINYSIITKENVDNNKEIEIYKENDKILQSVLPFLLFYFNFNQKKNN